MICAAIFVSIDHNCDEQLLRNISFVLLVLFIINQRKKISL